MRDYLHELRIKAVLRLFLTAYRLQRWASDEHKRLISLRSDAQVERMERKAGIR